jgi:hypothetical protein
MKNKPDSCVQLLHHLKALDITAGKSFNEHGHSLFVNMCIPTEWKYYAQNMFLLWVQKQADIFRMLEGDLERKCSNCITHIILAAALQCRRQGMLCYKGQIKILQ